MKYKVIDNCGIVYNMTFNKYVESEDIRACYIVWNISLDSKYESMVFYHKQYLYYENLQTSLAEDNFELILESEME